jgi:hypothetical protein
MMYAQKPTEEILSKKDQQRKTTVKTTKAVHVTACDYNAKIGLLALALIDKEVKIYKVSHQSTKSLLVEHFSFFTQFPSGAATCCLHIDNYVTNGRPIICLGSNQGDLAVYYLDDVREKREARGAPSLLTRFHFNEKGVKHEKPADDHQNEGETDS